MRAVEKGVARGSLKWLRVAVNQHSDLLNARVCEALNLPQSTKIVWTSPKEDDDFAEYRDGDFLKKVGAAELEAPLAKFWPAKGPQWDALATFGKDGIIIVEAKANIPEIVSPGTGATGNRLKHIERSLGETKAFLGVTAGTIWSGKLYQYANRLAHLFFLRTISKRRAYLVFVYFTGAHDVDGPDTKAEWLAAQGVVKGVLGLPKRHKLSRFVGDVYIDVKEMTDAA